MPQSGAAGIRPCFSCHFSVMAGAAVIENKEFLPVTPLAAVIVMSRVTAVLVKKRLVRCEVR